MKVFCNEHTHCKSTSSEKKVELLARKSMQQRERAEESSGLIRVWVEVKRAERMMSRR